MIATAEFVAAESTVSSAEAIASPEFAADVAAEAAIVEVTAAEATLAAEPTSPAAIMVPVATEPVVPITAVEPRMRVVPVVPRAGANEDAVCKPLRTPIAIGRAFIRIVRIVAKLTNGRPVVVIVRRAVRRADLHAERNLRMRIDCRHCQHRQQQ